MPHSAPIHDAASMVLGVVHCALNRFRVFAVFGSGTMLLSLSGEDHVTIKISITGIYKMNESMSQIDITIESPYA